MSFLKFKSSDATDSIKSVEVVINTDQVSALRLVEMDVDGNDGHQLEIITTDGTKLTFDKDAKKIFDALNGQVSFTEVNIE